MGTIVVHDEAVNNGNKCWITLTILNLTLSMVTPKDPFLAHQKSPIPQSTVEKDGRLSLQICWPMLSHAGAVEHLSFRTVFALSVGCCQFFIFDITSDWFTKLAKLATTAQWLQGLFLDIQPGSDISHHWIFGLFPIWKENRAINWKTFFRFKCVGSSQFGKWFCFEFTWI